MTTKKSTHGGARKGAGRPKSAVSNVGKALPFRIPPGRYEQVRKAIEYLQSIRGDSAGEVIARSIIARAESERLARSVYGGDGFPDHKP